MVVDRQIHLHAPGLRQPHIDSRIVGLRRIESVHVRTQGDPQAAAEALVLPVEKADLLLPLLPSEMLPALHERLCGAEISYRDLRQEIRIPGMHDIFQADIDRIHPELPSRHIEAVLQHDRSLRRGPAPEGAPHNRIAEHGSCMEMIMGIAVSSGELVAHRSGIIDGISEIGAGVQYQFAVHSLECAVCGEETFRLKVHRRSPIAGYHGLRPVIDKLHGPSHPDCRRGGHRLQHPLLLRPEGSPHRRLDDAHHAVVHLEEISDQSADSIDGLVRRVDRELLFINVVIRHTGMGLHADMVNAGELRDGL